MAQAQTKSVDMAIKCLECGYKMKTWQEVSQIATEAVLRYLGASSSTDSKLKANVVAGPANQLDIKCPKCKAARRWEDA